MRLKSFHGKSMADVMAQVRGSLGEDAIIVATHDEPGGVRVTAAMDDSQPALVNAVADKKPARETRIDPAIDEDDVIQKVTDVLLRHSAPSAVSELIISAVVGQNRQAPHDALVDALDMRFGFQPFNQDKIQRPKILIGPPGMGKTLTIAKLAAQSVMQGKSVAVFTSDTIRAGGVEQLEAFTRLMNINLVAVETPSALADGLAAVPSGVQQILIDTAGCNPYEVKELEELGAYVRESIAAVKAEPVLTLAAGIDPFESADIAEIFHEFGVRRLLPTRLDISRRLGGILAAAERCDLGFSDGGDTADVADGLVPLSAEKLADLLMGSAKRSRE